MYYNWLKIFMEGGKARLRGDDRRQATAPEVENLRHENERLKMLVADQVLEIQLLKKSLNGSEETGTTR
jgi:transposase